MPSYTYHKSEEGDTKKKGSARSNDCFRWLSNFLALEEKCIKLMKPFLERVLFYVQEWDEDLYSCKVIFFNVHGSVPHNNILIYVQQDATLHSYLETALHVLGGTTTHHQERKQLYLKHLVFVTPLLLSAAIGVKNTRCCRYSCMRSLWWVELPPETCRAVARYK